MLFCCCDPCPECTGSTCCGGYYPRSVGICCEDVWRMPGEGTCCDGVWYVTGTPGECCGGVWHTDEDSGDCCGGVWHPVPEGQTAPDTSATPFVPVAWEAEECPSGTIYARWGQYGECCKCIADQVFDPRAGEHEEGYPPPGAYVPTQTVIEDLCCDICSGPLYLPFDAYGNNIGCLGTCCADEDCSRLLESQCGPGVHPTRPEATYYSWTSGGFLYDQPCCANNPCAVPCCIAGDLVEVATFTVAGEVLEGEWTLTFGGTVFTYTADEWATAEDVAAGLAAAVSSPFSATATGANIEVTGPRTGDGTITPPGGTPQPPSPQVSDFAVYIVSGAVLVGEWTLFLPWLGYITGFSYIAGIGETRENIAAGLAAVVPPAFTATAMGAAIKVYGPFASTGTIESPDGVEHPAISSRTKLMSAGACSAMGGTPTPNSDCGCKAGQTCCEAATSSGTLLTFNKPPQFSGTVRVTVTGTTTSPILVYDTPFGETATPSKQCPFTHTFLLCQGTFNISPLPCGGTFHRVDVEVCYTEEATSTETFNFKGCNGPIALGACPTECATTLLYTGAGLTSSPAISLYRDSTIEANGTGPLVLTGNITPVASCVETLTLTGTSTAENKISGVIGNSAAGLSVRKTGTGDWWLTGLNAYGGRLRVLDGTLVVGAVARNGNSPFGACVNPSCLPRIGDPDATSGTASLLATGTVNRAFFVESGGGSQIVVLGGFGAGASRFASGNGVRLGRDVTLQASTGGTVTFANDWLDLSDNIDAATFGFVIGSDGNAGTVVLENFLPSPAAKVEVRHGTLRLDYEDTFGGTIWETTPVTVGDAGTSVTLIINGIDQPLSDLTLTGSGSDITGPSGGILRLVDSPTVTVTGTGHEISAAVTLDDDATFDGTGSLLISGVVSGSAGMTMDGSGTVTLSGANTYTGTTTINAGTLKVTGSLSDATAVEVASGATYEAASTHAIGSIAGAGSVALGSGVTLTAGALNTSTTYSGTMSGGGAFVKVGTGTLTLSGANTYTGTTTINSGTLKAGSLTAFGTGDIVVEAGGTLDKNGYAITNTITNNGGTVLN